MTYKVTIQIEAEDGTRIKVEMEQCPRETLIAMPGIASVLSVLEHHMPGTSTEP